MNPWITSAATPDLYKVRFQILLSYCLKKKKNYNESLSL